MGEKNKKSIRINRFVAMCGVCSRRRADELIKSGEIKINNIVMTNLGYQVLIKDVVSFKGKVISPEKKQYILLNKPEGYITTMNDEQGRPTVMTLIKGLVQERVVPVGRLDRETTGLLLFTNDGLLAKKLTHPKHRVNKTYHIVLDKKISKEDLLRIKTGLILEDGFIKVDKIVIINNNYKKIELDIHVGKNRIVRRIFEFLNYVVLALDRVKYSCLNQRGLTVGASRNLTHKELQILHKIN
tara:strand:- start:261 stop:986 length:726 start_codon:yes stop_codon:yes gene_type:complete